MTEGQWTVAGLLLLLFALEAVRLPAIKGWLQGALASISGAVSK